MRLAVGIESIKDILADLDAGFAAAGGSGDGGGADEVSEPELAGVPRRADARVGARNPVHGTRCRHELTPNPLPAPGTG